MMEDYPAAHSMDTEWFAVDASGNLAMFDSGEGGAVPESNDRVWQATRICYLDDFLLKMSENNEYRCIQLKIPGTTVAKNLTSKKFQGEIERALNPKYVVYTNGIKQDFDREKATLYQCFLQLSTDEAIARLGIEEIEDNYAVRFAGEPIIVYVKECLVRNVQKLVEDEQILAWKKIKLFSKELPSLFGLFVYYQDSSAPIPYTCEGKPIVPLCLDDLPEHLQDAVSWNWFDGLEFPDTEEIQPIEHMRCRTWSMNQWWLDTQGREHEEHPDRPF